MTDEAARHPFLASLPPHVRHAKVDEDGQPEQSWWQLTRSDVRGFVSTYLAAFAAILVFII